MKIVISGGMALCAFIASIPLYALPSATILRGDGLAPVRIGMTVAQIEEALGSKLRIEYPNGDGAEGCGLASRKDGRNADISYMIEGGRVTRIDVDPSAEGESHIVTAKGLTVGSTERAVRSIYGSSVATKPNSYDDKEHVLRVAAPDGKTAIVFEIHEGLVRALRAGQVPSVDYIEGCL